MPETTGALLTPTISPTSRRPVGSRSRLPPPGRRLPRFPNFDETSDPMRKLLLLLACSLIMSSSALALAADGTITVSNLRDKPDGWFTSTEGKKFIANIIAHQRPEGGWFKNYD